MHFLTYNHSKTTIVWKPPLASSVPAHSLSTATQHISWTDWLTDLRFNVPLDTKQVISEMLFPANLLASDEKMKIIKAIDL